MNIQELIKKAEKGEDIDTLIEELCNKAKEGHKYNYHYPVICGALKAYLGLAIEEILCLKKHYNELYI